MNRPDATAAENVTLAELLRSEPMRTIEMYALAGLERGVDLIRLVDDVEQIRTSRPGTLVVLQHGIAQTAWSTAIAVRYAWERNVRAVICQLDTAAARSVIGLAHRLSVPLGIYQGDLPALALELAVIVAHPEASRARLVARCAELIAQQDNVQAILNVVESELPGVKAVLQTRTRDTKAQSQNPAVSAVCVPMGLMDTRTGRELLATVEGSSFAWVRTVRTVLEIARPQIIACEAADQLQLAKQRRLEQWIFGQLVKHPESVSTPQNGSTGQVTNVPEAIDSPSDEVLVAARHLGWHPGPSLIAGRILLLDTTATIDDNLDLALAAAWPPNIALTGPIRHDAGWVVWYSFDAEENDREPADRAAPERRARHALSATLRRCLKEVAVGLPLVAGVGTPTGNGVGLDTSLRHAELAARVARRQTTSPVLAFQDLGARAFLEAADGPTLHDLAADTLAPLGAVEDHAALTSTLAAYLDCGGSSGRAAELLGVHRNTVSGRIDRVRRLGLTLDDPENRLGIHMAAHLLTNELQ